MATLFSYNLNSRLKHFLLKKVHFGNIFKKAVKSFQEEINSKPAGFAQNEQKKAHVNEINTKQRGKTVKIPSISVE